MALTVNTRLEVLQVYKLLQSVREEDTTKIGRLCTQGVPMLVNYCDPQRGECALHLAAQINNEAITKYLINLGAYPNVQDHQGRTPIMRAIDYGHVKTVEALIHAGADLKLLDHEGQDVIFYCFSSSSQRHEQCLEMVMANGANPDNTLESNKPTLVSACATAGENEKMCLTLIDICSDPKVRNKLNGKSALAEACSTGSVPVVRALLNKGADPNVPDKKLLTPLHRAAEAGSLDVVKLLVSYGADLRVIDKEANNPLHFAAEGGFGMICKYLGQRGCNPKEKNKDGFTPRLLAKEKGSKDASKELRKAEKLFTKYSNPDSHNPNNPDLLYFYDWICEREQQVRDVLTKAVTPPDETSEGSENTLTQQSFCDSMKMINAPMTEEIQKRVLEAHENEGKKSINVDEFLSGKKYVSKIYLMSAFEGKKKKGKKGKKGGKGKKGKLKIPLPICTDKDGPRRRDGGPPQKYLEKQLQWSDVSRFDRETPPEHPLQDDSAWYLQQPTKQYISITDAVKFEDIQTLKRAFENGLDVDARDKYFKTPLMASSAEGNLELTQYLLALGASVEARDNFKWTPLHHACHSGQLDVVQVLLYAGADGNATTWNGATPLMRAIESSKPEVVEFLLDCNVSVGMVNRKEKSAVDIARDWGSAEIYQMVKEKFDAAPKPKKDKKGNMRQPPIQPIILPGINKANSTLPDIWNPNKVLSGTLEEQQDPSGIASTLNAKWLERIDESKTVVDITMENYNRGEQLKKDKIAFLPKKAWIEQPTAQKLVDDKNEKRRRFGDDVDFGTFEKPLKQNFNLKVTEFIS